MPKGVLLVGPPAPARRSSRRPSRARPACRSSRSPAPSSSRCSSASARRASATCSSRRARRRPPSSSSTSSTRSGARAPPSAGIAGGHDEKEQTLNQLLVELDGFDPKTGIVLLAATNRPEILDPALLRAGRFDRQVLVDRPDRQGREQILRVHTRTVKLSPVASLEQVAALTPGFTGADLANLVNEAALVATRRGAERDRDGGLQPRHRAHRRRPREEEPPPQPEGARDRRPPRARPRASSPRRSPGPTRSTRSPSSRAASARSATPSSARPRTATS